MPLQYASGNGHAQLYCPGIGKNADDWAVVTVSVLYDASAAAHA